MQALAKPLDTFSQVAAIVARVTRYPLEILEADASLEQELGIDSVKLAEILAEVREAFGLPGTVQAPPEALTTLATIAAFVDGELGDRGASVANEAQAPDRLAVVPEAPVQVRAGARADVDAIVATVTGVFAELTRYPEDILEPDADLEQELGIDSVKLAEILATLRERFELSDALAAATGELRSIRGIAALIAREAPATAGSYSTESITNPQAVMPPTRRQSERSGQLFVDLAGKTVFVSGAGRGLGRTLALHLARAGATVAINSFHSRDLGEQTTADIRAEGGQAVHVWGSVANPSHIERMFAEVEDNFGGLDVFVSNASNGHVGPASEIDVEHWEKAFRTNVIGFHRSALAAAKLMAGRGGRIVSLSCTGATRYLEHFACLGAVKAAIESLTRSLAVELAPSGVTVNCISAGPVLGDLLCEQYPDRERLLPYWTERTPTGRLTAEDDVARTLLFMLSDAAGQINGTVVTVDGGGSLRI